MCKLRQGRGGDYSQNLDGLLDCGKYVGIVPPETPVEDGVIIGQNFKLAESTRADLAQTATDARNCCVHMAAF